MILQIVEYSFFITKFSVLYEKQNKVSIFKEIPIYLLPFQ